MSSLGVTWNLWHGCRPISAGCQNCYVYRMDRAYGRDPSVVYRTSDFDLPLRRRRDSSYVLSPGQTVYTCFTSDFFLPEADSWRPEAWAMMRKRPDLHFFIITKRIDRMEEGLPEDWGNGYKNVTLCCTAENNDRAALRLPIFLRLPIRHRFIVCEPLLEAVDLWRYLTDKIEGVIVGGESGENARPCRYEWVLSIREQCVERGVPFTFRQTGSRFLKDGRLYRIPHRLQLRQARAAGIDYPGSAPVSPLQEEFGDGMEG